MARLRLAPGFSRCYIKAARDIFYARRGNPGKRSFFFNRKHNYYRNAHGTSIAQEEQSTLPTRVIIANEDSDGADV